VGLTRSDCEAIPGTVSVSCDEPARADRHGVVVPLVVKSERASAFAQPVTVGIPLPKGALADPDSASLVDPAGRDTLVQAAGLARWSDGSVKWLLLDFILPGTEQGCQEWLVHLGPKEKRLVEGDVVGVSETSGSVCATTGRATFHLDRAGPLPLSRALVGKVEVLNPAAIGIYLTDAKGCQVKPRIESLVVETHGPVRTTVRAEGAFPGRGRLRFCARLSFFAGTGLVQVRLTLHNPKRARHRGGLWDLGDPGSVLFRELAMAVALCGQDEPVVSWTAEPGHPRRSTRGSALEIYQDSSGGENWQSRNHVNREGRVPCSFRGYRVRVEGREEHGLRASPVVTVDGECGSVTVAVAGFWQQFPKALGVDARRVIVHLFPAGHDDLFELQGGEQKTHTIWLDISPGRAPSVDRLAWVHQLAHVQFSPDWCASSGAVPYLTPLGERPRDVRDEFLFRAVEGDSSFVAGREVIDEYGWRHYGEIYAQHEAAYYPGPAPVVSHYNNQYDVIYGTIAQYLRSADARWREVFEPLARHVMDIDIYHTDQDRAAYNGGLFWHTDHYRDASTSTHRAYAQANQKPGVPYGGGPCNEHNYTTGLLHYYYLTGDPDAREAVRGLADWVIQMDDGRRTILGPVDNGPTGLASSTTQRDYHGPGRGAGNSINALLDGWLLTGRRVYLDKAEELIRRCIHPQDDLATRDLLNVEMRWSYTVFLSVLARYLDLKAESGNLDAVYAHARASLLHYASWMVENEVPYFDHPEKLEFPTETWAAQELRKANVLRLAAEHAAEPLRARLLQRGAELADRAWGDLFRFERPATPRALALLFTEGLKDVWFRTGTVGFKPSARGDHAFGIPKVFVPQRHRVLAQLKSGRGLVGALLRLVDWRRRWRSLGCAPDKNNSPPSIGTPKRTGKNK
jgi:hypothetical protein